MQNNDACLTLGFIYVILLQSPLAAQNAFAVQERPDRLAITQRDKIIAEYVFRDELILRPHFANLRTAQGSQVTRNQPPVPGTDAVDHPTMHPGVWLGFGDISGVDFWRNKGRIAHIQFIEPPQASGDRLSFATQSQLESPDNRPLGRFLDRMTLVARPDGWLLVWDATLDATVGGLALGDQEEMGFGARVATALTEKNGGKILNSKGQSTAKETWGQPASWCDYVGRIGDQPLGITLMASRQNFRPCWWHNRDYGLMVANPFGRSAMKQGDRSMVEVKPGQSLRLRFGACVHEGPGYDPVEAYNQFESLLVSVDETPPSKTRRE